MVDTDIAAEAPRTMRIPVVKAKGLKAEDGSALDFVDVAIDETLPAQYYEHALAAGLKVIVNGGTTKIAKEAFKTEAEFHEAAMNCARDRVQKMYDGKLKLGRGAQIEATTDVPSKVMTEARRIARELIKAAIKESGKKVTHYTASQITEAANDTIKAQPWIIEQAKKNLETRQTPSVKVDVSGLKESPDAVAKAEAKKKITKAASAGQLSAAAAKKTVLHASH